MKSNCPDGVKMAMHMLELVQWIDQTTRLLSQCSLSSPDLGTLTFTEYIRLIIFDLGIILFDFFIVVPWTTVPCTIRQPTRGACI